MISGLGIDLVDIPRFNEACKDPLFIQKYFAREEWNLTVQSLAGRFAARESLFKALNRKDIFSWEDIEVVSNHDGSPSFKLFGELYEFTKNSRIHLSITHSQNFAAAIVIVESA